MIMLDRRKEVEGLYLAARALPPGPERDRVLAESDPELRDEVEALLAGEADSTATAAVFGPGVRIGQYRIEAK